MRALRFLPHFRVVFVSIALAIAATGIAPVSADPGLDSGVVAWKAPETLGDALLRQAPAIDRRVLGLALQAHDLASSRGLLPRPELLTVIDYSRPSVDPRFWVFDLSARKLLFEERVAHGKNSGNRYATKFSNVESSLQTSLGLFVTRDVYQGKHGKSLRLDGLEPGVNDRALGRAIVIHAAAYVSDDAIRRLGYLGRSWGCPALSPEAASSVIDALQGGSAIFAFYPDRQWLSTSEFLAAPLAAATTG